ncbi:FmdB family zinc ribbon protein [Chitiniphilus eburneus]|uniref:Zinc ribbon domain-containing protein n=1 Tax=Chitiniphilus eburneus TaxID=2571148 RepID=A0A4U0Q3V4_9NEIS|nr:FmdB family zinc ribbon protein [Chitiniphilus eburneus]TJZ75679.1 zinc ribbon domain-containing protein [Chitiniphilus eburneus]
MPIYAYRCTACGFEDEHIQKMADSPLTDCPSCHAATYAKKLTAAGFQLKGSGWYATDFKGGASSSGASSAPSESTGASSAGGACGTGTCGCH